MRLWTVCTAVALVCVGAQSSQSNAALIRTDFNAGPMQAFASQEAFGVKVGDTITGSFVYDDSSFIAGTNFATPTALSIVFPERSWGVSDLGGNDVIVSLASDLSLIDWTLTLTDPITNDRVVIASNNTAALTEAGGFADLFCNNCVNFSQRQVAGTSTPVPAPAALPLALSGLALLALVPLRKRKRTLNFV